MTIIKRSVRRALINALSAFSWLSIRSRRQQLRSLIQREACALYLRPHSELGASERLLSAWSVLINIPSSWVMINANPIGCASDENPVSPGMPRQKPSHREWTEHRWCQRWEGDSALLKTTKLLMGGENLCTHWGPNAVPLPTAKTVSEKGGCFGEFSHWQLPYEQGSICQHPIWRTAEPLGAGPRGPQPESSGVVHSPRWGPDLSRSSIGGQTDTSWGETFDGAGMEEPR